MFIAISNSKNCEIKKEQSLKIWGPMLQIRVQAYHILYLIVKMEIKILQKRKGVNVQLVFRSIFFNSVSIM